jgi:hypothetical protein
MHEKQQPKAWLARFGLSAFLILILVIQNITLMPEALALNDKFTNLLLPSSLSSTSSGSSSTVNKDIPMVLPGNEMTSDKVPPSGLSDSIGLNRDTIISGPGLVPDPHDVVDIDELV